MRGVLDQESRGGVAMAWLLNFITSLNSQEGTVKRRGLIAAVLAVAVIGGGLWWYTGSDNVTGPGGESARATKVVISGFRSARFGMDEAAVQEAIKKDFGAEARIRVVDNTPQRTRVLALRVRNLVPDSPVAQLGYIFGYQSKKLMQVNAVWGSQVTPEVTGAELANLAISLKSHFTGLGFAPDKTIVDRRLRNGGMLVFQGRDDQDRMVRLVYMERPEQPAAGTRPSGGTGKRHYSLRLSYIAEPGAVDIYRPAPVAPAAPD